MFLNFTRKLLVIVQILSNWKKTNKLVEFVNIL